MKRWETVGGVEGRCVRQVAQAPDLHILVMDGWADWWTGMQVCGLWWKEEGKGECFYIFMVIDDLGEVLGFGGVLEARGPSPTVEYKVAL